MLLIFSCEELIRTNSEDCAGVEGGDAVIDNCGVCDSDSTNDCGQDCAGEWSPEGEENICGCANTTACNFDETATFNDGTCRWSDCAGECTCLNSENTNSCAVKEDCAGECEGAAVVDSCEVCSGGSTDHEADSDIDDCGVCFGTGVDTDGDQVCDVVSDIDGTAYQTVQINEKLWMAENLQVTHYNNGDEIQEQLTNLADGAYTIYPVSGYSETYGNLYNWHVVSDERGICPVGWHVPSDDEYTVLIDYLSGNLMAGGKMKECMEGACPESEYWDSSNIGATNESGFKAHPGGYYSVIDGFKGLGYIGYFWSNTEDMYNTQAKGLYLDAYSASINRVASNKSSYFSVRCIK